MNDEHTAEQIFWVLRHETLSIWSELARLQRASGRLCSSQLDMVQLCWKPVQIRKESPICKTLPGHSEVTSKRREPFPTFVSSVSMVGISTQATEGLKVWRWKMKAPYPASRALKVSPGQTGTSGTVEWSDNPDKTVAPLNFSHLLPSHLSRRHIWDRFLSGL